MKNEQCFFIIGPKGRDHFIIFRDNWQKRERFEKQGIERPEVVGFGKRIEQFVRLEK
mgnify:CR=1 FL=1